MDLGHDAVVYLATTHLVGTILNVLISLIYKSSVRVKGIGSWLVFILFSAAGGVLAWPAAAYLGTGGQHPAIILFAFALILSVPVIHWILPSLAPDFQVKSFGATFTMAVAVGIAAVLSYYAGAAISQTV